ncbi:MAG TPA: hypothetical protein VF418_11555 [Sphingomonadaceae bacterium]
MRRAFACAALTLALASCAGGRQGPDQLHGGILRPVAQPGEVVATELAFARAAQDKGQWTAFAQYAADDAVMYAPQPVLAKAWLKGRANPPQAVKWQPYQVWSSCDGSLAASRGAWQRPDGSVGYFTTIWQRQPDGGYKWVLDSGDKLSRPLAEPDLVQADIADCPARGQGRGSLVVHGKLPVAPVSGTPEDRGGQSLDGTLSWSARSAADGSRTISVLLSKGGAMKEIVHSQVSP